MSAPSFDAVEMIRKRPGMYAGPLDDGTGLHAMLFELVANAANEALSGHCDRIDIVLNAGGAATVRDNGRGIPVDIHPRTSKPIAEILMTTPVGGARFGLGMAARPISGVGVVVVNALSEALDLRIWRDGKAYAMRFCRGKLETALQIVGDTAIHGTEIAFTPDATIFPSIAFDIAAIDRHLRALAAHNAGATVTLTDRRGAIPTKVQYRI
jgi:DNA gyrase subunit B